jgi:integrase
VIVHEIDVHNVLRIASLALIAELNPCILSPQAMPIEFLTSLPIAFENLLLCTEFPTSTIRRTPSRVVKVPHIAKSGEDNVRSGFLAFDGYEKVLEELPLSLKCMFVVAYHIGNRKGALLDLKWQQVDFKNGVIRFIRMQNRKPVPLVAGAESNQDHVSFYESWGTAVKDAGFPDLLFHDLRRSAVRNMVEEIGMS